MITNIKNFIATNISIVALLLVPVYALAFQPTTSAADANIDQSLCAGANLNVNDTKCDPKSDNAGETVNNLIGTIINIFSVIVGVVAVIMIIVGGFRYITSGGDSGNVTGAKNTILYAIIGLVIVAFAQLIVRFVLSKTSEATSSAG